MDPATTTIRHFLIQAQRCIGCDAVAFTTPSREEFHFHCSGGAAYPSVEQMLRSTADTFLMQARTRTGANVSSPLVRNKVRYENGGPLIGRFLVAPVPDPAGDLAGIVMMFRPMTWEVFNEDNVREAARLSCQFARLLSLPADSLTGLFTRASMEPLVDWRLDALGETASSSVLYGDIDELHLTNDLLGFEAGDRVIEAVAHALAAALANDDAVLSRLSGDRFAVFLPDCPLPTAQQIGARLRDAVQARPLTVNDPPLSVSICFGAAAVHRGGRSFDHALAAAEVACKTAKEQGGNRVDVYRASAMRRRDDLAIVDGLRDALAQGSYQIFAQPIASLLTPDAVHRYEMLLRIVDEKGRLMLPSHFMAPATRYRLLPHIDRHVIVDVLDRLRAASARPGFKPVHVSINLSGPTVEDDAFLEWLQTQLEASGVDGEWLTFELTEAAATGNMQRTQALMSQLGARGCRFALDDFGTGPSSLAHLNSLQFASLKIDGSFIRDIQREERSQSLVRAVAQLASAMGMETVAECVETPEICMRLIELEVQFGQGFAIGKPRPLNGILAPTAELLHAS